MHNVCITSNNALDNENIHRLTFLMIFGLGFLVAQKMAQKLCLGVLFVMEHLQYFMSMTRFSSIKLH